MKLANFLADGKEHFGLVIEDDIIDLTVAQRLGTLDKTYSMDDFLSGGEDYLSKLRGVEEQLRAQPSESRWVRKLSEVQFRPPVQFPRKILCVGVNYLSHGHELGTAPSEPYIFFKPFTSIIGDGDDVIVPKFSTKADHEVELGVVVGKGGKDIQPDEAYNYVAGYTVVNDISFRDGMSRGVGGTILGRNWFKGKVADTSLPTGPFLVTRDEIPNPYPLRLQLRVNGDVRQNGTTDDMIFKIPELISYVSEDITLLPGDLIATGTCSGVALFTGKYLKDGDLVEAEVERVGVLRNTIRTQPKS
jgi:2-keto-4-pentenoate hydratase/2-oxohepta-3-ene-1,7-dioic acid hydratase in catechol pathway